jgi:hypothetical protein
MCVLSRHRGVAVKRLGIAFVLGSAVVAAATAALALEEQKGPAPAAGDETKAQVQGQAPAASKDSGTEIRIPGLGKLGTLPKMDFGLELLYGADQTENRDTGPAKEDQEDLTIHGSVKHRF